MGAARACTQNVGLAREVQLPAVQPPVEKLSKVHIAPSMNKVEPTT